MKRDDPLESWLSSAAMTLSPKVRARHQAEQHAALDRLADLLDHPHPQWVTLFNAGLFDYGGTVPLALEDLPRANELYMRLCSHSKEPGRAHVQEALLSLIAATEDPSSVQFWQDVIEYCPPDDPFTPRGKVISLAALARDAIDRNDPDAYNALRRLARHPDTEVCGLAVYYLGRAYIKAERPIPPEVMDDLNDIIANCSDVCQGYMARAVLRQAGLQVPLDNPGGVYAFKVSFVKNKDITRVIEVRSEQTLEDLHCAIQGALGWDCLHFYTFYINGVPQNRYYACHSPVEGGSFCADEAVIGEVGLKTGHKLLYHFDHKRNHQFEIEVTGIYPHAGTDHYPCCVEWHGKALPQYA